MYYDRIVQNLILFQEIVDEPTRMKNLFINPDRFFGEQVSEFGFQWSAAVVLLTGGALLVGNLVVVPDILQVYDTLGSVFTSAALVINILGGLLGVFLVWLLFSGLFYSISLIFESEGDFRTLLMYTGWTFVPLIFGGVSAGILTYFIIQGVSPPEEPSAISAYAAQIGSHPLTKVSQIITGAFTLWQGFLSAFAVKHARNVSFRNALLITAGPVMLSFVTTLIIRTV